MADVCDRGFDLIWESCERVVVWLLGLRLTIVNGTLRQIWHTLKATIQIKQHIGDMPSGPVTKHLLKLNIQESSEYQRIKG